MSSPTYPEHSESRHSTVDEQTIENDFADSFLQKRELGRMISRYMVLIPSEPMFLMMRPYQIYAVESIVDCIKQNRGNGFIWHTTGSGKTLTSFKASTLSNKPLTMAA